MNNKILSVVLVVWIATTWFAGISAANSGNLLGQNSELRELIKKSRSGETLSEEEQAALDALKWTLGEWFHEKKMKKWWDGFGKRAGFAHLTEDEKVALRAMSDDEKKAFFDEKKAEMEVQKILHKNVIDKLIAWESLTADEEATRLEMLTKFDEQTNKKKHPRKEGGEMIGKLLAGDELTEEEQQMLRDMQEIHKAREAEKAKIDAMSEEERHAYFKTKKLEIDRKMETIKALLEKKKAGETLTTQE